MRMTVSCGCVHSSFLGVFPECNQENDHHRSIYYPFPFLWWERETAIILWIVDIIYILQIGTIKWWKLFSSVFQTKNLNHGSQPSYFILLYFCKCICEHSNFWCFYFLVRVNYRKAASMIQLWGSTKPTHQRCRGTVRMSVWLWCERSDVFLLSLMIMSFKNHVLAYCVLCLLTIGYFHLRFTILTNWHVSWID